MEYSVLGSSQIVLYAKKGQLLEVKLFGHRFNRSIYIIHILFTDCLDEELKKNRARASE